MPTALNEPVAEREFRRPTAVLLDRSGSSADRVRYVSPEQHSLPRSLVLHLLPGAALFGFVLVAAALGVPAILALLVGIAIVIVPIELGYLLYQARSKSGRWSVWEVVDYRDPMPARRIAMWAVPLVAWFILMLFLSVAVLSRTTWEIERLGGEEAAKAAIASGAIAGTVADGKLGDVELTATPQKLDAFLASEKGAALFTEKLVTLKRAAP